LIWVVLLAVVSIVVFLSLVTGSFREAANRIYCGFYLTISKFFSGVETTSIPSFCKTIKTEMKVVELKDQDNKIFSRVFLSYVIDCWKGAEIEENYETHTCYELRVLKPVDNVSEKNVTDVLIKEDHCKSIENSDYNCGVMNQIIWDVGDLIINNQKIILIEYSSELDGIKVIA